MPKNVTEQCDWVLDPIDGFWSSACGEMHEFTVDGPEENGYKYCPYCGDTLTIVKPAAEGLEAPE